jgi:hypothetical protein
VFCGFCGKGCPVNIATVTGVTATPTGRFLVRVLCPWCRRIHIHAILRGHTDHQAPSCGTPASYLITIPSLTSEAVT